VNHQYGICFIYHVSGAYNVEVAPRFLENLSTSGLVHCSVMVMSIINSEMQFLLLPFLTSHLSLQELILLRCIRKIVKRSY
jgi:hypothetical protein